MARGQELLKHLNELITSGTTNRATLAHRCHVSISTVQRNLSATQKRIGKYTTGRSICLTSMEKAIIEGGILGDGRLIKNSRGAAFSFSNNKRELVEWVALRLNRLVVSDPNARYMQARSVNEFNGTSRFQTATWKDLACLEQQWYRVADQETLLRQPWRYYRKQIKPDFRLTPLSALLWYLGDGSLVCKVTKDTSQVIRFATHDLPLSGLVGTLVPQLVDILHCAPNEISVHRDKRVQGYPEYGFEIYIPARYVPRWLQFIGPCPETITSYQYKWAYRGESVRKRWLNDELDLIRKYWGRLPHDKICAGLNVTYEQARKAARRCGLHRAYSNSGRPLHADTEIQGFRKDLHAIKENLSRPTWTAGENWL